MRKNVTRENNNKSVRLIVIIAFFCFLALLFINNPIQEIFQGIFNGFKDSFH